MNEDLQSMDDAKLRRRSRQAWDTAGFARQDCDAADEKRRTAEALAYDAELARRARGGDPS